VPAQSRGEQDIPIELGPLTKLHGVAGVDMNVETEKSTAVKRLQSQTQTNNGCHSGSALVYTIGIALVEVKRRMKRKH